MLQQTPEDFLKAGLQDDDIKKIEDLIAARNQARTDKQWQVADEIRDQLLSMGISLEDAAQGTLWRKG
jgi:cysteinyl-tRNA synthetase